MNRIRFLAKASAGAALATTGGRAVAAGLSDVPGGTDLVEARTAFDAAAFATRIGKKAEIRQVWENLALRPNVFNNIKNSLNGLQFSFGYAPDAIAMAVANHGPSSVYTFSDAIWTKYRIGDLLDVKDKAGDRISTNVFYPAKNGASASTDPNDEHGTYQDTGIAALQARGVVFLTCHTAVEEQARALVAAGHAPPGMSGSDVASDILTHLIPGAFVVPSMVATVAVMQQRFGYTYTTVQS